MATGIKDKVAILGMGCTRFGERWESGAEELMVEAFEECLADAGIDILVNIETDDQREQHHRPQEKPALGILPECQGFAPQHLVVK